MEKITLKPAIKELIYKSGEDNVHFDVLAYQGAGNQEKMLGSLFVLGHIKYSQEDLSYTISLISSLAKREYYSDISLREQNAKSAFERTLKKLNEVLDDFFQNNNFKLNIGLAAISGENIYISRLGKFKIALARNGKYIDILNNVELFSKDAEGEKQFSNIISGKVQSKDKIFAYFPSRSLTSREKQLNGIFIKENQEEFGQKIAHLATNTTNFSCCGVHIDMHEVKEIPVSSATYTKSTFKTRTPNDNKEKETEPEAPLESQNTKQPSQIRLNSGKPQDVPDQIPEITVADQGTGPESPEMEQSRIIPAEFLVSKRETILTPVIKGLRKLISTGKLGERARRRGFILVSAIIIFPVLIFVLWKTGGISNENRNTIKQAGENVKLAQSWLNQSNFKDARTLLQASLASLASFSDKKAENIKLQINQTLDDLDRVSDKQPTLFADISAQNSNLKVSFVSAYDGLISIIDIIGLIFNVNQNEVSQLGQFKITPQFLYTSSSFASVFNGSDAFGIYDLKSKKIEQYTLKEPVSAIDAILYENNLYILSDKTIYKYADAVTGGTKRTIWTSDNASGNLTSITADGNIYALADNGKLILYFKGKKTGELDLRLIPASDSRIFTFKDSAFLFLADKTNKRVYIFDKTTGELKTTYKLEAVGTPQDISVSSDGTVWILSTDNKIWTLK
ncbi:MAG: hypothetical protein HYX20_00340 [Candidatus Yanofskybacteria bacterium]|nr:hypothetical protein [Candidatus Yanofskybacteria bacterium]